MHDVLSSAAANLEHQAVIGQDLFQHRRNRRFIAFRRWACQSSALENVQSFAAHVFPFRWSRGAGQMEFRPYRAEANKGTMLRRLCLPPIVAWCQLARAMLRDRDRVRPNRGYLRAI